jgi:hypothetical protein
MLMERSEIFTSISQIAATPVSELTRNSKQDSTILFQELTNVMNEIVQVFGLVSQREIDRLPLSYQRDFLENAEHIINNVMAVVTMKKNPKEPEETQKQSATRYFTYGPNKRTEAYANSYFSHRDEVWNRIMQAKTLEEEYQRKEDAGVEGLTPLGEARLQANSIVSELEGILGSAKDELAKRGVSVHQELFKEQAVSFGREALTWRSWVQWLLVINVTILLGILAIVLWLNELKVPQRVEVGIFGVAVVSLISFALVLCVRNYFASKHNEIVNRHKANCLGTYNTFIDSADSERKAAVLLQATQTIFSHQRSGYLTREAEVSSPNPIVEIIRQSPLGRSAE